MAVRSFLKGEWDWTTQGVLEMRELFLELKASGKTILLASHNKEDINVLCDEVYEIDRGIMKRV